MHGGFDRIRVHRARFRCQYRQCTGSSRPCECIRCSSARGLQPTYGAAGETSRVLEPVRASPSMECQVGKRVARAFHRASWHLTNNFPWPILGRGALSGLGPNLNRKGQIRPFREALKAFHLRRKCQRKPGTATFMRPIYYAKPCGMPALESVTMLRHAAEPLAELRLIPSISSTLRRPFGYGAGELLRPARCRNA